MDNFNRSLYFKVLQGINEKMLAGYNAVTTTNKQTIFFPVEFLFLNEIALLYQTAAPETPIRKNYFAKVKGAKHMEGMRLGAGMQALGAESEQKQ